MQKNRTPQKVAVIILKSEQCDFTIGYRKTPKISDTRKNAVLILKFKPYVSTIVSCIQTMQTVLQPV